MTADLPDGARTVTVTTRNGRSYDQVVLVGEDEPWTAPAPVTYLTVGEILAYRPSEEPTWTAMVAAATADHPERHAALIASIREHGIRTPVEIDPDRGVVERGHHRIAAAVDAGYPELIPVIWGRQPERWDWDHRTDSHVPYHYDLVDFEDDD